jgi:hypothetical protein
MNTWSVMLTFTMLLPSISSTSDLARLQAVSFEKAFDDHSQAELRTILQHWKESEGERDTANLSPIERAALQIFDLGYYSQPLDSVTLSRPFMLIQDSIQFYIGHQWIEEESLIEYTQRLKSPHSAPIERYHTTHWKYDSQVRSVGIPSALTPKNTLYTGGAFYRELNMFIWGSPKGYGLLDPTPVSYIVRQKRGAFVREALARFDYSEFPVTDAVSSVTFDSTLTTAHFWRMEGDGSEY